MKKIALSMAAFALLWETALPVSATVAPSNPTISASTEDTATHKVRKHRKHARHKHSRHFYVVEKDGSCKIVQRKRLGKNQTMVGKYFYKTRTDAKRAMGKQPTCQA